jgi:alanine racemase
VALVLEVDRSRWDTHVAATAARVPRLIPVVKGNGYGLGRDWLAARAASLAPTLAVGTVHEVASVPRGRLAVVLTPTLDPSPLDAVVLARDEVVLTVGSAAHLAALGSTPRRVVVKIRSSMHRYGVPIGELASFLDASRTAGHSVDAVSIHLPLDGDPNEASRMIDDVDTSLPVHLSHVTIEQLDDLATRHARHSLHLRLGTHLWHGDKESMRLRADVLDTEVVSAGTRVGYRSLATPYDGTLVMIGCGSSHGVAPLSDGRSPFHFARQRLDLIEPPHMHSSMALTRLDQPTPVVGDRVDVQRPLTQTTPDSIEWI